MPDIHLPDPIQHPFPFLVIDDLWDNSLLQSIADEFPTKEDLRWKRYKNKTENKLEGPPNLWGPRTNEMFDRLSALSEEIERVFKLPKLVMETIGGGYHYIEPGGHLAVHTDFNRSPTSGLYRQVNLLIYLNHDWKESDGGLLELWDEQGPAIKIAPEFNRTVIFRTSDTSWHGHPTPNTRDRKSIASYFFTAEKPADYSKQHSTIWHPNAVR